MLAAVAIIMQSLQFSSRRSTAGAWSRNVESLVAEAGYNSNLASEFYVLSVLHRLGLDAALSLGNKKSVDVTVIRDEGDAVTIDVKASATKADWILGKHKPPKYPTRHFLALVGYEGTISNPATQPRVWVVPYEKASTFLKLYAGDTTNVSRRLLLESGQEFENAWHLLAKPVG